MKQETETLVSSLKNALASSAPSTSSQNLEEKKTDIPNADGRSSVFMSLFSAMLLAPYLLPNALLRSLSPFVAIAVRAGQQTASAALMDTLILLAGCIVAWLFYLGRIRLRSTTTGTSQLWALTGIYFGLYVVNALFGTSGGNSGLSTSVAVISALCCGLLAARLCSTAGNARRIVCILGVLQAVWALLNFKSGLHVSATGGYIHPTGTFEDPQALALLAVLSLPVAVNEALRTRSTGGIAFWGLGTAVLLGVLLAVWDGASLLATLLSLGFLAVASVKRARVTMTVGLLLMALLLSTVQRSSRLSMNLSLPNLSLAAQGQGWRHALQVFCASPWNGTGLGSLKSPVDVAPVVGATDASQIPDNLLLHWLIETGIGGGLFLCLFVVTLVRVLRQKEGEDRNILQAQWIAVASVSLFHSFFGSANRPLGALLFACLLGSTLLPEQLTSRILPEGVVPAGSKRAWRFAPELFFVAAMLALSTVFVVATVNRSHAKAPQTPVVTKLLTLSSATLLQNRHDFLGLSSSPYTLVEFGDYECPPCRAIRPAVQDLLATYPRKIRLDYRNLPMYTLHAHAMYAATVAESARQEGRFHEAYALLFGASLNDESIAEIAGRCLKEGHLTSALTETARRAVETDMTLAQTLGIEGTPGFLLCCPDGKVYRIDSPMAAEPWLK